MLEGQGPALVILVLRECIWNALAVTLVLSVFDDTGPWVILRVDGLSLWFSPRVTTSLFLTENRETELKSTTFFLHLLLHVFLSFPF